jgi:hypothetical protein
VDSWKSMVFRFSLTDLDLEEQRLILCRLFLLEVEHWLPFSIYVAGCQHSVSQLAEQSTQIGAC